MDFYAHSGTPGDKSDWQGLSEHLLAVARRAAENAKPFGLERAAFMTGLLHDLGKYNPAFQRRLEGARSPVDHSTAGAALLMSWAKERRVDRAMAEIVSYCVLGHHAGLPDKNTADPSCFKLRCERFEDRLDPAWKEEVALDLTELMPGPLLERMQRGGPYAAFDLSVVARFLFSALVDADYKDTESFYAAREGRQLDRDWAPLSDLLPDFSSRFDAYMAGKPSDTDLNRLRGDILGHVRANAAMSPGLFTLTVPTGGGKTLASLGFALDHARAHGHRRIIYSIPFAGARIETWRSTTRASSATGRPSRGGADRNRAGKAPSGGP